MKSEVIEPSINRCGIFPALYKSPTCGAVALFSEPDAAVVIKGSKFLTVGEVGSGFITQKGMSNTFFSNFRWTRLPSGSQVILTQE